MTGALLLALLVAAQPSGYRVTADLPEEPIEVGSVFYLQLRVEHPEGERIPAPEAPESDAFRFVSAETERGAGETVHRMRLMALALPGERAFPSVRFDVGGEAPLETGPIPIAVATSLAEDLADVHDIRGPFLIRVPPRYGLIALILLGVLALVAAAWWFRRRRRQPAPAPPPLGPAAEADLALGRLARSGLLEAGDVEAFLDRLSAAMKRYAGRRFETAWLERTSDEMRRDLDLRLEAEQLRALGGILDYADFAKFSEGRLRPDAARTCLERARSFVERTA